MPGCYTHVWLFLFTVFAKEILGVTVQTGLYSRVELRGEKLDQHTADSLLSVEWTKQSTSAKCLCLQFTRLNRTSRLYSPCCGRAHFNLNNNSLILENVTTQVEGVFTETVVTKTQAVKSIQNFTLHILYPPNATGIVVSWTSNTSVSLRCEVMGSFTYLMWMKDSSILEDNKHSFSERNQTLHISNITSSDCGTYSCVVTNTYGQSETQTCITNETCSVHCENSAHYHEEHGPNAEPRINHILITSGLPIIGVLGLCIMFCGIYRHRRSHRGENDRTTEEGGVNIGHDVYEEIPDTEEVSPLPYVYTDFIKPRPANQNTAAAAAAAAEPLVDFGYSEIGSAATEKTLILDCVNSYEQFRPCPNSGEK